MGLEKEIRKMILDLKKLSIAVGYKKYSNVIAELEYFLEREPRYTWDEWVEFVRRDPVKANKAKLGNYLLSTFGEIKEVLKVVDFKGVPVLESLGTDPRFSIKEFFEILEKLEENYLIWNSGKKPPLGKPPGELFDYALGIDFEIAEKWIKKNPVKVKEILERD